MMCCQDCAHLIDENQRLRGEIEKLKEVSIATDLLRRGFDHSCSEPLANAEAVINHLVEHDAEKVLVDGKEVRTDDEYKLALGLKLGQEYPHPIGLTSDWATLEWLRNPKTPIAEAKCET